MTPDLSSLDDLYKEARAVVRQAAKAANAAEQAGDPAVSTWSLTNFRPVQGVALVHSGSGRLLGNFTEYVHKTIPGARRLIRENPGLPVRSTEYVTGDWFGTEAPTATTTPPVHRRVELRAAVQLPQLQAVAPSVHLRVHLDGQRVTAIELTQRTLFQLILEQSAFMYLPAGTEIMSELSPACLSTIQAEATK